MAQLDLSHHQSNGCSAVDTIFHCVPDVLGNIEEALLKMLALRAHVISGSVRGLAERLQLCL
jgi:hypothetical protein